MGNPRLFFLAGLGRSFVQYVQAQNRYVAAEGTILKSNVRAIHVGRRAGKAWRPVVVYSYKAGDATLQGDQINLGEFFSTGPRCRPGDLRPVSLAFRGDRVLRPTRSSRAVLDLEFMNYYAFALFGMSFFIIAGLGLIVVDAWLWLVPAESDDVTPHFPPRSSDRRAS